MHIARLPVLSYSQLIMGSDEVVTVSRSALEALLRAAAMGFSVGDMDAASYLRPCSDIVPIVRNRVWRDELVHLVRNASEDEGEASGVEIQWFDDVAQAIDFGAVNETPLSLVDGLC